MEAHDEIRTLADQLLRDLEQARIDSDARFKAMMEQCDKLLAMIDAAQAGVKALDSLGDEWTPWPGGECPVHQGNSVTVKYRGGSIERFGAGAFRWHHEGSQWDIVAYKVEG